MRKLGQPDKDLRFTYEAGACGFDSVAFFCFLTLSLLSLGLSHGYFRRTTQSRREPYLGRSPARRMI